MTPDMSLRAWLGQQYRRLPWTEGRTVPSTADDSPVDGTARRSAAPPSREEVFFETGRTPEQYVLEMVQGEGGRVRQQELCEYTGWSESSISRLLSRMEESDLVSRCYIGREKLVHLPSDGPGDQQLGPADD